MQRPTRILVPVDLSPRSQLAVDYGAMLAEATGATLVLHTNVNLPERALLEERYRKQDGSVEEAADLALSEIAASLADSITVEHRATFRDFPADSILELTAADGIDMIVIGSHGRSGMTRWMLGSVAEKVSRHAEVPVVIVPARS